MPSNTDEFGNSPFILTNPSRGSFHLYGDNPGEIHIKDIANSLSKQCRFTGHFVESAWYSVAEHSVDVSHIIGLLGGTKEEKFAGLMHDTPEAYLSDINAPFKREIGQYYDKEALIWARIAAKFGVPEKLPAIVKTADWVALFIEAMTFVVPDHHEMLETWVGAEDHLPIAKSIGYKMAGLTHNQARKLFLARFKELCNG